MDSSTSKEVSYVLKPNKRDDEFLRKKEKKEKRQIMEQEHL